MNRYFKKSESALGILWKMKAILLFVPQNFVCLLGDNGWLLKQVNLNTNLMTGVGYKGAQGHYFKRHNVL